MSFEQILYQVSDRVATLTLNRPDKLNAWTARMEDEVTEAVRQAAADPQVRVIVLTGAGRGFCAGADMSLLSAAAGDGASRITRPAVEFSFGDGVRPDLQKKHVWLLSVPKPILAAINGPAVGLGFVIPLYCDLRIASQTARFSAVFSRRGLIAEYGMAWMLPRLVGLPNAVDLLLTSRMVDAQEALRIGLVNRVLPEAGFAEAVQGMARELASSVSPRSLRVIKKQIYDAQFQTLGEAVDRSWEEMQASLQCEDFREGVAHFLEKRAPDFSGR